MTEDQDGEMEGSAKTNCALLGSSAGKMRHLAWRDMGANKRKECRGDVSSRSPEEGGKSRELPTVNRFFLRNALFCSSRVATNFQSLGTIRHSPWSRYC